MSTGYRLVLLAAALGLSACATTSEDTARTAPPREPSILDPDEAYIARVEAIARRRGIEVQWVNAPRKTASQVAREKAELQPVSR